ncbi:Uncharacterised protein [Serratia proteamaculans]|nr:Uncharacterised protein [Serratia proteamaculans]
MRLHLLIAQSTPISEVVIATLDITHIYIAITQIHSHLLNG